MSDTDLISSSTRLEGVRLDCYTFLYYAGHTEVRIDGRRATISILAGDITLGEARKWVRTFNAGREYGEQVGTQKLQHNLKLLLNIPLTGLTFP